MIQSTIALNYDARDGIKQAVIELEIKSWAVNEDGIIYTVNDYAVNGDVKELIGIVERFRSWDQLNSLNDYLESQYSYSGLNKRDREFLKVKHGLLLETQTKPVYGSSAQQWVLIENTAV